MTLSPETESLAERYARLSREGTDRRGVDAAHRILDILISATPSPVSARITAMSSRSAPKPR